MKKDLKIAESRLKMEIKFAALDKRLEVHQEAYALCRRLTTKIGKIEEFRGAIEDCKQWWDNNCLYLSENIRNVFFSAYFNADISVLYEIEGDYKERRKLLDKIYESVKLIEQGVYLPPINIREIEENATSYPLKNSIL